MMRAFAEFIGPESPLALLIRVTIVLAIAWTCDAALRWASPRWRIFSWRVSVVGAIVVAALSYCPPAMTLPLLPVRSTPINDSSAAAAEATHASRLSVAALPNSHEDATR